MRIKSGKKITFTLLFTLLFTTFFTLSSFAIPPQIASADAAGGVFGENTDEFIKSAVDLMNFYWDDDYIAAITMKSGENSFYIDGDGFTAAGPAIIKDGEAFLPMLDIAGALGVEIVNNSKGVYGGEGSAPLYPAREIEAALGVDIRISGDVAVITKPYQLKQIVLTVKDAKELADTRGAEQYATNGRGLYLLQYATEARAKSAFDAFSADPGISYVTLNKIIKISNTDAAENGAGPAPSDLTVRWGSERVSADLYKDYLAANGKTGEIVVAVVDTGVDASHPYLRDRMTGGANFTEYGATPYDDYGHGTHVSGIVADCSPQNVKIMPVKSINDSGYGNEFALGLGVEYAADNGAKVINMSFSGYCDDDACLLGKAAAYAIEKGAAPVASAGNGGVGVSIVCPAKYANLITVSSVDISDKPAPFANYGGSIDVCAPGENILSSIPGGGYMHCSGASTAAPHVSAAVAMLALDYPGSTPGELFKLVRSAAVDAGPPGPDASYGAGILDFRKLLGIVTPAAEVHLSCLYAETANSVLAPPIWLEANVAPSNATDKSVGFTSSDENVAIYKDGRIIPVGAGTAVITAAASPEAGPTARCEVTVRESSFWIDCASESYAGGDGSEDNPYLISKPEHLAKLAFDVIVDGVKHGAGFYLNGIYKDTYFKLTGDIDLAGKEWTAICHNLGASGSAEKILGFAGYLDGNGKVIYNMECGGNAPGYYMGGLFGAVGYGGVHDLAIVNANVTRTDAAIFSQHMSAGILAESVSDSAVIRNCYTTGKSDGGGFAGEVFNAAIYNCFSTADAKRGGFATYLYNNAVIANCYSAGSSGHSGGFAHNSYGNVYNSFSYIETESGVGFTDIKSNGVISNCYYLSGNDRGVATDEYYGRKSLSQAGTDFFPDAGSYADAGNWDAKYPWDFTDVWKIDKNINDGLPYLKKLPPPPEYKRVKPDRQTWYHYAEGAFAGGRGTRGDPYLIKTPGQLARISWLYRFGGADGLWFQMENDIDLAGREWFPIAKAQSAGMFDADPNMAFRGNISGNGHTIKNMAIDADDDYNGFISNIAGGGVRDLTIENADVSGRAFTGGVAGIMFAGAIENCGVFGKISGADLTGGILGKAISREQTRLNVNIKNCRVDAVVRGSIAGGLVGGLEAGFPGSCVVGDSYATGSVTSTGDRCLWRWYPAAGGLIGDMVGGSVKGCRSDCSVSGALLSGGLIGNRDDSYGYLSEVNDSYYNAGAGLRGAGGGNQDGMYAETGGAAVVSENVPETRFEDVGASDWYYGDVAFVSSRGVMNGTYKDPVLFSPNMALTRGMCVMLLYNMEGRPDADGLPGEFYDTDGGAYYASAVKWASDRRIVLGYYDGAFRPDDCLTRQDFAVILTRYAGYAGLELPRGNGYPEFGDNAEILDYALEPVIKCCEAGIILGNPGGAFNPAGPLTRAEAAAILHRFLSLNQ